MRYYLFDESKCNQCGPKIRRLRKAMNMSQEKMAGKCQIAGLNVNQKAISRTETGKRIVPDYELLFYSEFFGVPITELFESIDI